MALTSQTHQQPHQERRDRRKHLSFHFLVFLPILRIVKAIPVRKNQYHMSRICTRENRSHLKKIFLPMGSRYMAAIHKRLDP